MQYVAMLQCILIMLCSSVSHKPLGNQLPWSIDQALQTNTHTLEVVCLLIFAS